MARVEFFFDCSSPWTYLAFSQIEHICKKASAQLDLKPILVGGIFNKINQEVYETRANPHPVKGKYYVKDLQDWANYAGLKIGMPSVFPVRAVTMMRMAIVAQEEGCLPAFAKACFEAYWGDLKDVGQDDVLLEICAALSLNGPDILARAKSDEVKAQLAANTQEVMDRGGFGSPTIFVDGDDMYFGNDRLSLLAHRLGLDTSFRRA
ncbi:MAG: 2-hydroxychromene-2-carboxylate isomerase [Alphaproteobacteria bacterium]